MIDVDRWLRDIKEGICFRSTIPTGYGLGSSGAIVAAVADRYSAIGEFTPIESKNILATMECCFHAQSSGIDPYICLTGQSILAQGLELKPVTVSSTDDNFAVCLIDTGISRSSVKAIDQFSSYLESPKNLDRLKEYYLPAVNNAIDLLLERKFDRLYEHFSAISHFQIEALSFLIDEGSKGMWGEGLQSDYFKLKICGAGQGGFLLCMTNNMERLKKSYPNRKIIAL